MRPYSLSEICSIKESLDKLTKYEEENFKSELSYRAGDLNEQEVSDFCSFSKKLMSVLPQDHNSDGWFLGTILEPIPNFDAILFSKEIIVDLELKNKIGSQNEESIIKKFKKQNHLLDKVKRTFSFFNKDTEILYLAYIVEEDRLLKYNLFDRQYTAINFNELAQKVKNIKEPLMLNPIEKLSRSDFLISPLNNIQEFINGDYYLSDAQETYKKNILAAGYKGVYGIKGKAGSGKSLIAYDLVKQFNDKNKKILFIFPGKLKDKHREFESYYSNLEFSSGKNVTTDILNQKDIVIIDEAQRLYYNGENSALSILRQWIEKNYKNKMILFFYDSHQALGPKDCGTMIDSMFSAYTKDKKGKVWELPKSIRSNPAISAFVDQLFDLGHRPKKQITSELMQKRVEVRYFANAEQADPWIKSRINVGYQFIIPTGSMFNDSSSDKFANLFTLSKNTHEILGEENDNVVTYIDDSMGYDSNRKLKVETGKYRNYYFIENEFYVNLTRAKEKLSLVVVGNYDIYSAIINVIFHCNNHYEEETIVRNYIERCSRIEELQKLENLIQKRKFMCK
ncbi:DUF2075 domain-containing protein [Lactobacillus crispatus]|uniref:DUF2075 domain-containing protein n=2 Tax=Lactobacillus crispatus TaxID=47770 RepID=A0A2N5KZB9_9LACO|nr:DNA/RNA helicase domain-containing protein [Lactobacillus crispatus]MDK7320903.1 DUF2075 domain-containing protein [Lactobacillus crispatus]MDK8273185.1 DUF2075 domain-containing protein [Lactobacillus crispatus]MDK8569370.1 DUF2075 domain-containing protein [Lactobacillus crispatus]PLT11564.1 DUF2075 domain-containing protein [Lactobacillus crispatus]PLT12694.1 DUF2075 domain-containing protein [Lactobacillus crispatus]